MTDYRGHTVREILDRIRSIDETIAQAGPIQSLAAKRAALQAELDRRSGF